MFENIAEVIQRNRAEAARLEAKKNADRVEEYKLAVDNIELNAPIRAAKGLAPIPVPETPEVYHAMFDEQNFVIVVMSGPERHPKYEVPKVVVAPPPPTGQLGEFWFGRTDVRMPLPGDASPNGAEVFFDGKTWVMVRTPFGGGYWKVK
jgi:hypothetical protein